MTDEELLEEAYRRYPIGTRFISNISDGGIERIVEPYHDEKKRMSYTVIGEESNPTIYVQEGMRSPLGTCSNPRLYTNGKWCPLLEEIINYEIF